MSNKRAYLRTSRGRAAKMLASARRRAKRKNLPFTITADWVVERLERGRCEVTGINFDLEGFVDGDTNGMTKAFLPTLDRLDGSQGYTPENTRVVVNIHNMARMNFDLPSFRHYIYMAFHALENGKGY